MSQSLLHQVTYSDPISIRTRSKTANCLNPFYIRSRIPTGLLAILAILALQVSQSLLHQVTYSDSRGQRENQLTSFCVSIPFTSGHVFRLESCSRTAFTMTIVSIPFTSGHVFRRCLLFPHCCVSLNVSIPFTSVHVFRQIGPVHGKGGFGSVSIPFTSGHVFRLPLTRRISSFGSSLNPFYIRSRIPTSYRFNACRYE